MSLYERIQADADCLIDYEVKHNSSGQSFSSAIDGSPNQGHLAVLSGSVVPPNEQNSSSGKEAQKYNVSEDDLIYLCFPDVSLDTRYQSFPNDFDEHHPDGLNIISPNNSDVTSHDSAIDLNDDH